MLPLETEHIAKAEWNEKLANTLSRTAFLDWAITVTFYSALHYVDSVLACSGTHPENHTARSDAMTSAAILFQIRKEYRLLETLSRNSRYRLLQICPNDLLKAQQAFAALKTSLRKNLGLEQ